MKQANVCVRGTGAVGMSLALALSRLGLEVALAGRPNRAAAADVRTYALNAGAVALLRQLKVWNALPPDAYAPVHDMLIQGDAHNAALDFSAWTLGAEALAWIVDAAELDAALQAAVRFAPHVRLVGDDEVAADLLAIAEGKASASRDKLGVAMPLQPYGQHGVAARLVADVAHIGLARQWFAAPDILALLPFERPQPGHSYGLVWSVPQARAEELLAMDEARFEAELQQASAGAAGGLRLSSPRQSWPLMVGRAAQTCGPGWVLLGDAAHVVHPLAGQGLNLGLADVAALASVLAGREPWRALGDEKLLKRYARQRLVPTLAMSGLTDGLWQLFAHSHPAAKELRNRGLTLVQHLPALKRFLAQQALHS